MKESNIGLYIFKRVVNFSIMVLLLWFPIHAKEQLVLTLDKSIDIALDKSFSIKNLQQYVISAERNLWAARAGYNTRITSNFSMPQYDEGFKLIEQVEGNPVAKQFQSLQVLGRLDIIQPIPWMPFGGGDLIFRSEAFQLNDISPSQYLQNTKIKTNQFYTSLSLIINKPLFTINDVALELKQAKLNYTRQRKFFKRSELDLVYEVTNSFFRLYQLSELVKINKEKVERQKEIYQTTKNKFDAGLIAEVDAMQAEVDLIQYQNELKSSEGDLKRQEMAFKQLIGIPLDVEVRVVADLEVKKVDINIDEAMRMALKNRSEIVEKQIDIENQKINIKQIDARVSIKGSLTGYYRFAGYSDRDLPWGTPTSDLIESSWEVLKKTPNRGVTFNLEVPIWDWGRNRAQVEAARAALKRYQLELDNLYITIKREVENAIRKVDEAYDRVKMLEKSRQVSEKAFEISYQRFANGEITSTELARATDQLNTAKMNYLAAYNEYRLALADLRRKTLYDFEKNKSLVEDNEEY